MKIQLHGQCRARHVSGEFARITCSSKKHREDDTRIRSKHCTKKDTREISRETVCDTLRKTDENYICYAKSTASRDATKMKQEIRESKTKTTRGSYPH